MPRQHLRIFVATGTGPPFPRLLAGVRPLATAAGVELFVQRGAAGPQFPDLPGCDFVPREAFAERLAWADVVVCHAGAGALYEAYTAGHTPVVLPRLARFAEAINDHQLELARSLAADGRIALCETEGELARRSLSPPQRVAPRLAGDALVAAVREALLDGDSGAGRQGLRSRATGIALRFARAAAGTASLARRRSRG